MTVSIVKEGSSKVMIVAGEISIQELVELFEQALRGAGFVFNGHFELEEE